MIRSPALSHVVLIGHGSDTGILFGTSMRSASEVGQTIAQTPHAKVFLSLCCHTGRASFAKVFSAFPACDALIAPFNSVHGAVASQFCQTFFASNLLAGKTTKVAFKSTRNSVPGNDVLKLWQKGKESK